MPLPGIMTGKGPAPALSGGIPLPGSGIDIDMGGARDGIWPVVICASGMTGPPGGIGVGASRRMGGVGGS